MKNHKLTICEIGWGCNCDGPCDHHNWQDTVIGFFARIICTIFHNHPYTP